MRTFKKHINRTWDTSVFQLDEVYKELTEVLEEKKSWKEVFPTVTAYDHLLKYKNDPNIFISFVSNLAPQNPIRKSGERRDEYRDTKIGMNPRSTYDTPLGIYTYPVKKYWKRIESWNIHYQGEQPFIYILRKNSNYKTLVMDKTYTEEQLKRDIKKLLTLWKKAFAAGTNVQFGRDNDIIEFKRIYGKAKRTTQKASPDGILWNFVRLLSMELADISPRKSSNFDVPVASRNTVIWNSLMRSLGYGSAVDYGTGIIHKNEPTQAVFFTRKAFDVIDRIRNKQYTPIEQYISNLKTLSPKIQAQIVQASPQYVFIYSDKFTDDMKQSVMKRILQDSNFFSSIDERIDAIQFLEYLQSSKQLIPFIESDSFRIYNQDILRSYNTTGANFAFAAFKAYGNDFDALPPELQEKFYNSDEGIEKLMEIYNYDYSKFPENFKELVSRSHKAMYNFFEHLNFDLSIIPPDLLKKFLNDAENTYISKIIKQFIHDDKEIPQVFLDYLKYSSENSYEIIDYCYQMDLFDKIPREALTGILSNRYTFTNYLELINYNADKMTPEMVEEAAKHYNSLWKCISKNWITEDGVTMPQTMLNAVIKYPELCGRILAYLNFDISNVPPEIVKCALEDEQIINIWLERNPQTIPKDIIEKYKNTPTYCLLLAKNELKNSKKISKELFDCIAQNDNSSRVIISDIISNSGISGINNIPENVLNSAYNNIKSVSELKYILQNSSITSSNDIPEKLWPFILQSPGLCFYIAELFGVKNIPKKALEAISTDKYYLRRLFINYPKFELFPPDVIVKQFASDPGSSYDIAERLRFRIDLIPKELIKSIATDPEYSYSFFKGAVSENKETPPEILKSIATDAYKSFDAAWFVGFDYTRITHDIYTSANQVANIEWKNAPEKEVKQEPKKEPEEVPEKAPKEAPKPPPKLTLPKPNVEPPTYGNPLGVSVLETHKQMKKENVFYSLYEKIYTLQNENDYARYYDIFSKEYLKSMGKTWSYDKFADRARNWTFFGDENGFVAVRIQNSGYVKLVGTAGSMKSKYKGMKELLDQKYPLWGVVTGDLATMAQKMGFVRPPAMIIKTLIKFLPKTAFSSEPITVNNDGSLNIAYGDVGNVKKYFIATPRYFFKLLKDTAFKAPQALIMQLKRLLNIK
jgi:hypothetical protein